ncbi:ComF family protein [Lactiplantibacillus plantarum]|uniref:ComF family protein n=1 Tax=Lactiplantibacillus plantarum TaxID=1590 RepID=UPI001BAA0BDC|nr:ComF family protein [Lactiplantibacillus plantarum]MBS0936288.1 ComF family protein [Lactiplantibacillus plantarum]MBS0943671.1 ComF family protein [Lactiplantibacillus plantarum]
MLACLLCHNIITTKFTLPWILSWQPVMRPVVCSVCWRQFVRIDRATACSKCGRAQKRPQPCTDCQRWPEIGPFHNEALFEYNDAMHDYFQRYKFQGDYQLRQVFAKIMQQAVVQRCAEICLVVPVTPTTLQTRGFNQVAGWLAAPLAPGLMTQATAKSVPQSKKDRQARLRTPQPFKMAPNTILAGRRVLLVDDIYTTGRTMHHAATLLLKIGAKSVTGLTLAR